MKGKKNRRKSSEMWEKGENERMAQKV